MPDSHQSICISNYPYTNKVQNTSGFNRSKFDGNKKQTTKPIDSMLINLLYMYAVKVAKYYLSNYTAIRIFKQYAWINTKQEGTNSKI